MANLLLVRQCALLFWCSDWHFTARSDPARTGRKPLTEAIMRRTMLHTVGILGALFAGSSNVSAQPLDGYYPPYPHVQPYPPGNYLPPLSYALPPGSLPAPNYAVLPDYHAPRADAGAPYVRYGGAPASGYAPPPVAEYVPPAPVLIPLRPRSCGQYRYWNGEYCADARYERPYLGPRW